MVRRENPPPRQHFREKFFRCPFQYPKVPLEAGAPPPPPSFDASHALVHGSQKHSAHTKAQRFE